VPSRERGDPLSLLGPTLSLYSAGPSREGGEAPPYLLGWAEWSGGGGPSLIYLAGLTGEGGRPLPLCSAGPSREGGGASLIYSAGPSRKGGRPLPLYSAGPSRERRGRPLSLYSAVPSRGRGRSLVLYSAVPRREG